MSDFNQCVVSKRTALSGQNSALLFSSGIVSHFEPPATQIAQLETGQTSQEVVSGQPQFHLEKDRSEEQGTAGEKTDQNVSHD
jgi:hypothetical protein